MNTKKRILAILLAGLLTTSLAACNGGGGSGSSDGGGNSSTSSDTGNTSSADSGEITKLVIWGDGTAETEDCNEVAAAVNEIAREEIGVEIELVRGSNTTDQVNLAMTSGEDIDLLNYNSCGGLDTMVRNSWASPLDDLVEEYGQGALGVIDPQDLETCRFDGVLYALPDMRDSSRNTGFSMRKDIIDELGIEVPEYGSYEEMHDILAKVHEAYPDMYPLVPTWAGGGMQDPFPIDPLGDKLGVLENAFEDSTEVVNFYATDTYREFCEMMYQWNQEGLIMPDATTTTENNLLSGNGFAMFENWKPGKEFENYKANNREVVFMKLLEDNYKYTTICNGNSFIIPYSSTHKEKAMEFWNLMYTNAEVSNLLINGIEGKHWEWADDSHTFITVPEGVDRNASGYSSLDFAWPNQQITPVWEGNPENLWEQLDEFNRTGHPSPAAMGYSWDTTSMLNEITSCNNIVSQYDTALKWGSLNPAETLDQFNAELEAAGINEIIAEKQRQLDEYLASKE